MLLLLEEMMSRTDKKLAPGRPNGRIASNKLRDRTERSRDRTKGSSQDTNPFQSAIVVPFSSEFEVVMFSTGGITFCEGK